MAFDLDHARTLRGAICGTVAAAVWALQQPLDKLAFGTRYDDVELLGRAVTGGAGWYPAGWTLHLQNGALFGAAYANVAPAMPLPPPLRGPAAGLAEHIALWPLVRLSDRFHPARKQLPALSGNWRAFAQATWRHLLFGLVLGALEQLLNAGPQAAPIAAEVPFSSNGHGSLEQALPVERTS